MKSSVLLITPPPDFKPDLGADTAANLELGARCLQESIYPVVAIFHGEPSLGDLAPFLTSLEQIAPNSQKILFAPQLNDLELLAASHSTGFFRILQSEPFDTMADTIHLALERFNFDQQERDLLKMVHEQNDRLTSLNKDLEARVQRRQRTLSRARDRLLETNRQIESLHSAFLAIHRARSIGEVESLLSEALTRGLQLSWVRILLRQQTAYTPDFRETHRPLDHETYFVPLEIGNFDFGEIVFVRPSAKPFSEDEIDLLHQVAEAVSLGLDRLTKLEQAEVLKQQWQATFDSISEPLCLTDSQFRILRTNQAFAQIVKREFNQLMNLNCFEMFFDQTKVDEFFSLGSNFKTRRSRLGDNGSRMYEVAVQALHFQAHEDDVVLVIFRDITSQQQLERQVLEASKMAELGLIGSSIAHELNNPLGGMLSFIQLIKMELNGTEPYAADIREMEGAAQRSREIVQNLLGFARKVGSSDRRDTDLRELIEQSLRITELQTRSQGIKVHLDLPATPVTFHAQSNQLIQAFCNILQNAGEAILERRKSDARRAGQMDVRLQEVDGEIQLTIHDDGVGISPELQKKIFNPHFSTKATGLNTGLGLTVAYKIIAEHNGKLEISSQSGVGTTARISFRRLDLQS